MVEYLFIESFHRNTVNVCRSLVSPLEVPRYRVITCKSGEKGVWITVWHSLSLEKTQIFESIAEGFREVEPDIEVEIIRAGSYTETFEKLLVNIAAGTAPNISMLEQARTQALAAEGAVVPLTQYIEGPYGFDVNDLYPGLLDFVTFDGEIYALPYNVSTLVNYINMTMVEEVGLQPVPPLTWDAYYDYSIRLARDTDGDGVNDILGMDLYSMGWQFENWLGQNGARVLNEDGTKFTLNSPEAVAAMEFLQDIIYYRQAGAIHSQSAGYEMFWQGRLGMAARSTATVKTNQERAAGLFDLHIAEMPCNVECYVSIGGANFSMINTGTDEEKLAAWKFLAYMTNTENLAKFAAASGYMASRRSSVESEIMQYEFRTDPFMTVTYRQLEYAHPRPKVPLGNLYDSQLTSAHKPLFAEGRNPKEVLDQLNARLQAMLDAFYAQQQ